MRRWCMRSSCGELGCGSETVEDEGIYGGGEMYLNIVHSNDTPSFTNQLLCVGATPSIRSSCSGVCSVHDPYRRDPTIMPAYHA